MSVQVHDDGKGKYQSVSAVVDLISTEDMGVVQIGITGFGKDSIEAGINLLDQCLWARHRIDSYIGNLTPFTEEIKHSFGDGKYTLVEQNGKITAYRCGEPWPAGTQELIGDGLTLAMLHDYNTLHQLFRELYKKFDGMQKYVSELKALGLEKNIRLRNYEDMHQGYLQRGTTIHRYETLMADAVRAMNALEEDMAMRARFKAAWLGEDVSDVALDVSHGRLMAFDSARRGMALVANPTDTAKETSNKGVEEIDPVAVMQENKELYLLLEEFMEQTTPYYSLAGMEGIRAKVRDKIVSNLNRMNKHDF